jgi:hypothetical protein
MCSRLANASRAIAEACPGLHPVANLLLAASLTPTLVSPGVL